MLKFYKKKGWKTQKTKAGADQGVDLIIEKKQLLNWCTV
ncbi:restriction endonuclease [Zobellia nedashkovskayae]